MSNQKQLEARVIAALREQSAVYQEAIEVAQPLAKDFDLSERNQVLMKKLGELMSRIAELENGARPLFSEWSDRFVGGSESVIAARQSLVTHIKQLLQLTSEIEKLANARKSNLRPIMNQQLQLRNAQSAYSHK